MKILMILSKPYIHDPRVTREAKSLSDNGYNVRVIVWDRNSRYEKESLIDNIKVYRIHNDFFMKFLQKDLFRNYFWWRKAYKKGLELYNSGFKFDVVHCHDLDTLRSGVWLKKKLDVKLFYDAHEIFGYMIARNMPKFVVNYGLNMEKKLLKYVDQIITVSEPLKEYFQSITDKNISIIMNCKDLVSEKYIPSNNKVFTICYIGTLHKNRMFPEIVDIIGNIKDVKFIIAGRKESLYDEVEERSKKYDNIDFLRTIPIDEVIPTTLKSDVVFGMINPADRNDRNALLNKQFEAMVCGRPILCSDNTYSGKFTKKLECGLGIGYKKEDIVNSIHELKNDNTICRRLGENGLKAAIKSYNWKNQEKILINLYNNIL